MKVFKDYEEEFDFISNIVYSINEIIATIRSGQNKVRIREYDNALHLITMARTKLQSIENQLVGVVNKMISLKQDFRKETKEKQPTTEVHEKKSEDKKSKEKEQRPKKSEEEDNTSSDKKTKKNKTKKKR